MTTLRAAVADPAPARQFDPEITDMASYVHNFDIDSDLAVSSAAAKRPKSRTARLHLA